MTHAENSMGGPQQRSGQGSVRILLASGSPRRADLLRASGIDFVRATINDVDETYPESVAATDVAAYLSELKNRAYTTPLPARDMLLTADTTVILECENEGENKRANIGAKVLGKPLDRGEAIAMLQSLSGRSHTVITAVTLRGLAVQRAIECRKIVPVENEQVKLTASGTIATLSVYSTVLFRALSMREIEYYVDTFKPLDKAGSYGIQEWIGEVGVVEIQGSYTNIIGLPLSHLFAHFPSIFTR